MNWFKTWLNRTWKSRLRRSWTQSATRSYGESLQFRPAVEVLEDRYQPSWVPVGPSPQLNPLGGTLGTIGQPVSGRIADMAIVTDYDGQHLGHQALVLGAASGGIWWSDNFGTDVPTWTPRTDNVGLPVGTTTGFGAGATSVGAIAIDPFDSQIVYLGTGEANGSNSQPGTGILKSTDGGRTWTLITSPISNSPFLGQSVSELFVDPTNDEGRSQPGKTLYAATVSRTLQGDFLGEPGQSGIYKSTDGGVSWFRISQSLELLAPAGRDLIVTDLDYTISNGRLQIFAGVGDTRGLAKNGVYVGTNTADGQGLTWVKRQILDAGGVPIPGTSIGRIALASDHISTVYAALVRVSAAPGENGTLINIFKSTNAGATWTATNPPGNVLGQGGHFDIGMELSPSGRLYVGGQDPTLPVSGGVFLLESNVGATAWRVINLGTNGVRPHVDVHSWAFTCDGTAYLGTDGGIYRYTPLPFDAASTVNLGSRPDGPMALGDVNRDGKLDMVVAAAAGVQVLPGLGDGTFGAALATLDAGNNPSAIAVADMNNDGRMDIVVGGTDVFVFFQTAGGAFFLQDGNSLPISGRAGSIVVGNFDGIGGLDIAVSQQAGTRISVLYADPNLPRRFLPEKRFPSSARGGQVGQIVVGDFNRDGNLDLAVNGTTQGGVNLLLRDPSDPRNFLAPRFFTTGRSPESLAVGDVNNDGWLDLIVGNFRDGSISVLLGDTADANRAPADKRFFLQARSFAVEGLQGLTVNDFNGDGNLDIAAVRSGNRVAVFHGQGQGDFVLSANYDVPTANSTFLVTTGDINGDRKPDILVPTTRGTSVSVLLSNAKITQTGLGTWEDLNTPGLQTIQHLGFALHPTDRNIMLATSVDNGTARTTDGGRTWNTTAAGDTFRVRYSSDGSIAYMTHQGIFEILESGPPARTRTHRFFFSTDNGATWQILPGFPERRDDFDERMPLAVHPTEAAQLLVASRTAVWERRTDLQGPFWTRLGSIPAGSEPILNTEGISAVSYGAAGNGNQIFFAHADGRIAFIQRGQPVVMLPAPWRNPALPISTVGSIIPHPTKANTLYVTIRGVADDPADPNSSQVWVTTNNGASWTPISFANGTRVLPNVNAHHLVIDPDAANPTVYVATHDGVYRGTSNAEAGPWTWTREAGFPNVPVVDLQLRKYADGTKVLGAATHGRGVWINTLAGGVAPAITGMTPTTGPASGGTGVTITGSGFTGATAVLFGDTPARFFRVESDTSIFVTSPPISIGTTPFVPVRVVTPGGTSAASGPFTYTSTVPTITGMTPNNGLTTGDTSVTITGTGFTDARRVTFGGVPVEFVVNSDTQITVCTPPDGQRTVDVFVTNLQGNSTPSRFSKFTYLRPGASTVSTIIPGSGGGGGGSSITIIGTNLSGVTQVLFGDTPAATFVANSDIEVTATVPPHAPGVIDIRLVSRDQVTGQQVVTPVSAQTSFTFRDTRRQAQLQLTPSSNPTVFSQPVLFSVTAMGASPGDPVPTGSVEFRNGETILGSATLTGGVASLAVNGLAVGAYEVTAVYQGDANFSGAATSVIHLVYPAATEIRLSTDPNPSMSSDVVRLLIAFRGSPPSTLTPSTGVFNFFDTFNGQTNLWFSITLGQPSPPIPLLEAGSHILFAVYSGNESFLGSTSNFHAHTVLPSSPITTADFNALDDLFAAGFSSD